jgi:hypothetical protein
LVDVCALLAFGVDLLVVEVGPEVVVARLRVGQQMPDDYEDGAADGDDRLLAAAAAGDAPIAFAEEGVGPAGGDRSLTDDLGQVAVAVPGALVFRSFC